jgi:hypothetical protein
MSEFFSGGGGGSRIEHFNEANPAFDTQKGTTKTFVMSLAGVYPFFVQKDID